MRALTTLIVLASLSACPGPGPASRPNHPKAKPTTQPAAKVAPKDPWAGAKLIAPPSHVAAGAMKLPKLGRFTLKNGLSVLVLEDHKLPLIDVRLMLRVGSSDDPPKRVGVSDFTAMMLRQGVAGLGAEQIAERVDAEGAHLSVAPGYEISSVGCSGRMRSLSLCLQMVAKLVTRPTFPAKEMAQVARQLEGGVRSDRDDPDMLATKHFYNVLYGDDHPLGRPLTLDAIAAIKRADLQRFHRRHYVPRGAVLAVAGPVDVAALKKTLTREFGAWRGGKAPLRKIEPVKDPPAGLRVLLVDKDDLTQSFFVLGHAGVTFRDPARDALRVANYVLGGGGFSSRLMKVVRSEGGKTYGISSAFYAHEFDGQFRVRSSTKNDEIVKTLDLVRRELAAIRTRPPTAAEIEAAKGKIAGGYAIAYKTSARLAAALAMSEVRKLGDAYVSELPLRIERLTAEQVADAARKHIHPDHLVAAIVGKASVVAPLLRAAKIPFTQVGYLEPISARARAAERAGAQISPKEAKAGRALLAKATKAMGGAKALAKVRSLRLTGEMRRGPMTSRYAALYLPPDHLRISFVLTGAAAAGRPQLKIEQVLAGKQAFMMANGQKKALPAAQAASLRGALFRQNALVLRHAAHKGVKLRPSKDRSIDRRSQVGLDIFPAQQRPLTLVFERKTLRLVELRYRGRDGKLRKNELSGHKQVAGLWLPHDQRVPSAKVALHLDSIEINPPITKADITR